MSQPPPPPEPPAATSRAGRRRRRPVPGRTRVVLAVALVVAGLLAAVPVGWGVHAWLGMRAVHDHAVFEVFTDRLGYTVTHDQRFTAGPLDRLFLGGMIEHPIQREMHLDPGAVPLGVLAVRIEDELFGIRGQETATALGLTWDRRVSGTSAVSYTGVPPRGRGRLHMVTVRIGPEGVHVRTFGR